MVRSSGVSGVVRSCVRRDETETETETETTLIDYNTGSIVSIMGVK